MARTATAQFAGNLHAPARARQFARIAIGHAANEIEHNDVATIVSELVTNSVRAGALTVSVTVLLDAGEVRIEVGDDVPGRPAIRATGPTDVSGRGLQLVAALAAQWGVSRGPRAGKQVWATVALAAV